ncbi:hypothetical protein [Delftia acidovorans]|uniref:hypothetical protein n=1 Tax=Delftia acidovorans TaxID=80866 RepID=UPI003D0C549A
MTASSDNEIDLPISKIDNYCIVVPKSASGLQFQIGANLVTGSPAVGDVIVHTETGRRFVISERRWLSGAKRDVNVELVLRDETTDPEKE